MALLRMASLAIRAEAEWGMVKIARVCSCFFEVDCGADEIVDFSLSVCACRQVMLANCLWVRVNVDETGVDGARGLGGWTNASDVVRKTVHIDRISNLGGMVTNQMI